MRNNYVSVHIDVIKFIDLISKDGGTFPLFSLDWSAEEEVLLLDAIEQHGFGNW